MILLFICISYLLKVFRFDTGILRDSFAVPLLKTLRRLPQSEAFYAWFCFTRLLTNFPFHAFATMICWASTEVLLNLIACLDSAVLSLDFEQINILWTFGFDSVSILFNIFWTFSGYGLLNFSRGLSKSCCSLDLDVPSLDFE